MERTYKRVWELLRPQGKTDLRLHTITIYQFVSTSAHKKFCDLSPNYKTQAILRFSRTNDLHPLRNDVAKLFRYSVLVDESRLKGCSDLGGTLLSVYKITRITLFPEQGFVIAIRIAASFRPKSALIYADALDNP